MPVDRFMTVSDTYDYAVPDISGISSCSATHQPLLIQPALQQQQQQQHPQLQPKLPAASPPSLTIEIDTLASQSSHSTVTNGSSSSARLNASGGKNNNQIGHYNCTSESASPLKKVSDGDGQLRRSLGLSL